MTRLQTVTKLEEHDFEPKAAHICVAGDSDLRVGIDVVRTADLGHAEAGSHYVHLVRTKEGRWGALFIGGDELSDEIFIAESLKEVVDAIATVAFDGDPVALYLLAMLGVLEVRYDALADL